MKNSLRFNIFKRDEFVCQYCGKRPPEIILEVDHIIPRIKGGTDTIENLITACKECNSGKGKHNLKEVPKSAKISSKELEEKSKQLNALYEYQQEVAMFFESNIEELNGYWEKLWDNKYSLNTRGKGTIKMFLKDFTPEEIKEAMLIATKINEVGRAYRYMCGILHTKRRQRQEGYGKKESS